MLKEKQLQLQERLNTIIHGLISDSRNWDKIKASVVSEFKERNLSLMRASFAMSGKLDLRTLTNDENDIMFLFIFSYALDKAMEGNENIQINVEEYFTQYEVAKWKNYIAEKTAENIYPLVIKNVQYVNPNMWQTVMSAQELHEMNVANMLVYNFKTQRNPKVTALGEKINIDKKKIAEIKNRMLENKQKADNIILNVVDDGESRVEYNEQDGELIIYEGSVINIVDGHNRKTANSIAVTENPGLEFNWQITFTFYTENQAYDYMAQKNKQTPMRKEYIKVRDYNKPENMVVKLIMDDMISELAKKTQDTEEYIKNNRALTKKSILAQAILDNYGEQLKASINLRKIAKWIVEFTDHLMASYEKEFISDPYRIKQSSMINHKNMFAGYIALSAELYGNKEWENLLQKKMESINFSVDNPMWRDMGIKSNYDMNKTTREKLYKLFREDVN